MEDYDLIIVGAGPSGLFCGINSMKRGKRVLILEKKDSPGHKLLISGSGHCNLTHQGDIRDFLNHFGGPNQARFLRPALLGFTNNHLVSFFKDLGLEMIPEKGGKMFPETLHARDVLRILIDQCRKNDIAIKCNQNVTAIDRDNGGFLVRCEGKVFRARMLVIATGGCSYPATGSTGDGYRFASSLGHHLVEIGPALTNLIIKDYPFPDLAGLSIPDIKTSLYRSTKINEHRGDILFTHDGLSGPGILDQSRSVRAGDIIKLSFVPEEQKAAMEKWLMDEARQDGGKSILSALSNLPFSTSGLSIKLTKRILEISGISFDLHLAQLTRENRNRLIENFTGLPLVVSDLGGFSTAMVTRGGVNTIEVNSKTMQSRLVEGLYLVGEVLDIDGDTGGYNLQAAFSTGMLAARSIKAKI